MKWTVEVQICEELGGIVFTIKALLCKDRKQVCADDVGSFQKTGIASGLTIGRARGKTECEKRKRDLATNSKTKPNARSIRTADT